MKSITKLSVCLAASLLLAAIPSHAQSVRTVAKDGSITINTTEIGQEFIGHHATTPVEIVVNKGKIISVTALPSDETPSFYEKAITLLKSFAGMTVEEASKAEVDAVTGSTMSSKALIQNVKEGLKYVKADARKKQ